MSALPTSLSSARDTVDAVVWDYDGTLVATRFADEAAVAPSAAAAIFDRDVMRGSLGKDVEWDVWGPLSRRPLTQSMHGRHGASRKRCCDVPPRLGVAGAARW